MYSGSSLPIIRLLQSKSLCRSSKGTPISSAMAWSGSSAATSTTKSHEPFAMAASRIARRSLTDERLEGADHSGREPLVDQLAVAGVLRRIHRQHDLRLAVIGRRDDRLLQADHAAVVGVRRVGVRVATDGIHVLVLGDHPEAGSAVGLVEMLDRRVVPQIGEPFMRDTLREHVTIQQIDVRKLHQLFHPLDPGRGPYFSRAAAATGSTMTDTTLLGVQSNVPGLVGYTRTYLPFWICIIMKQGENPRRSVGAIHPSA